MRDGARLLAVRRPVCRAGVLRASCRRPTPHRVNWRGGNRPLRAVVPIPGITDGAGRYLVGSSGLVTINGPREIAVGAKGLPLRKGAFRARPMGQPE